jgi:hypothetical protein
MSRVAESQLAKSTARFEPDELKPWSKASNWIFRKDWINWALSWILCALFALAGWLLIPRHGQLLDRPFFLTGWTSQQGSSWGPLPPSSEIHVNVMQESQGHYLVGIEFKGGQLSTVATLDALFQFQPYVIIGACRPVACTPSSLAPHSYQVTNLATNESDVIPVTTSSFIYGSNGENAEVWLPGIMRPAPVPSPDPTATIFASYQVPNAGNYDWTGGDSPEIGRSGPVWEQYVTQLANPVLAQGIDTASQRSDDLRIFLAGASAALAGATFATGLDGFVRWKQNRRRTIIRTSQ